MPFTGATKTTKLHQHYWLCVTVDTKNLELREKNSGNPSSVTDEKCKFLFVKRLAHLTALEGLVGFLLIQNISAW